ncbi:hypothetical protein NKH77_22165 [Streptomyces sp. M19]
MSEPETDIHTTAGKLADLQRRIEEATHAGSARAVEKQHAKGKLTARERIDLLLDEGPSRSWTSSHGTARPTSASRRTVRTATVW